MKVVQNVLSVFIFIQNNTHTGKAEYRKYSVYLSLFFDVVTTAVQTLVPTHYKMKDGAVLDFVLPYGKTPLDSSFRASHACHELV